MRTGNSFAVHVLSAVVVALSAGACSSPEPRSGLDNPTPRAGAPTLATPPTDAASPAEFPGLHNVVTYAPGLISGGAPEGDAAFDSLRAMGVRTVISVDGAKPDLPAAKARGLRYIHLPIGYDGMDDQRTLEIARAIQLARAENPDAPVYLHCHHGKHRSAGALGAAAVTLGELTPAQAEIKLKISGTSPSYPGLYECVAVAHPATREQLAAVGDDFPEVWPTSSLVQGMVEIDERFDHLKAIEKAGWRAPADHPDLVPAAEAGRLADLFRELADTSDTRALGDAHIRAMLAAGAEAQRLEDLIVAANSTDSGAREALSPQMKLLAKSCTDCHKQFRN